MNNSTTADATCALTLEIRRYAAQNHEDREHGLERADVHLNADVRPSLSSLAKVGEPRWFIVYEFSWKGDSLLSARKHLGVFGDHFASASKAALCASQFGPNHRLVAIITG